MAGEQRREPPPDDLARLASPGLLGRRLRIPVMRPRDHLVIEVRAADCVVTVDDRGVPLLVPGPAATQPRLIIVFPPQHVAERVFQEKQGSGDPPALNPAAGTPETPVLPAGAAFAASSRLVYVLGTTDRVELTVAGVLEAMGRLRLAVAPLAEPRFVWRLLTEFPVVGVAAGAGSAAATVIDRVRVSRVLAAAGLRRQIVSLGPDERAAIARVPADQRQQLIVEINRGRFDPGWIIELPVRPERRPPTSLETAIEAPSRLQLSPSEDGAWAHARAVDLTPDALVELWHTRLGVRADDGGVDEQTTGQRTVRAVWTRDGMTGSPPDALHPFRMSLTPTNRRDIVELSTGAPGTLWRLPAPAPVQVNKLHLTSLGAFLDVRGSWDVPGNAFTEWQHRTTLGRDQYVRVVLKGYLFPFGHRAVLVTETRRRVDPLLPDGDTAILWQRHFIMLRDHVRSYSGRDLPFTQITIDPKTTPDINDPGPDPTIVWPMIGTTHLPFKITAVDQDGIERGYSAPLLWVAERDRHTGKPSAADVLAAYGLTQDAAGALHDKPGLGALVEHDLGNQRIAVAAKGPAGEAAYETQVLRFAADPGVATCQPSLLYGRFVIPAVAAVTGTKQALPLSYARAYLDHGFAAAGNTVEVVLVNAENAARPSLSYGTTDRSGGFLDPSQHIDGVSRITGPVSNVAAATAGTPVNPGDLFAGLGKILGLFELGDILHVLGLGEVPAYVSQVLDIAGAISGGVDRAIGLLPAAGATRAMLQDAATSLDALMHRTAPPPAAAEFTSLITTKLEPAIAAGRAELTALAKAQAAAVQRALDTVDAVLHNPAVDPAALLASLATGRPVAGVLTHVHLQWQPPVAQWPGTAPHDAIFLPDPDRKDTLLLAVDVRGGDLVPAPSAQVLAQLTDFTLQLLPGIPLVHIPFKRLYFRASTGAKTEIDVDLGQLQWLGVLGFVNKLRDLIPTDGFTDPPSVTVDGRGITAGFSIGLPNVAVGVFNLSNLSLAAQLQLPFVGNAPTVGFAFCTRERPFTLAVMFLGGGGFFGLRLNSKKLVLLEAALEFGATLALDFGVASGSVSCMAGVYLRLAADNGSLAGYLRIRGQVQVLGLISACIELYMQLAYEFGSGKVVGSATITVEVEVLMFSTSVSISTERRFAGSKGDPTFADALGPYDPAGCPWIDYCQAFAEV